MTREEISAVVQRQRAYFETGATLPVEKRMEGLRRLRQALLDREEEIANALKADLGKSGEESYMCEIGMTVSEISHMLRSVKRYAEEQRVPTPLAQFASRSFKKPSPYGVVLIMSPWNYPILLTLGPLVDALAAGNTAVVKPSAYAPAVSEVIRSLLEECFPPEYVSVITGGRAENTWLLEEKFDYIFFTGSKGVGQTVLEKAAKYLTPATLELGGKSPCIVDQSANLKLAARRMVFGKYLNCGQTCVAPDYVLCHASVKQELLGYLKAELERQYGADFRTNPTYGKIVNEKHFDRLLGLIDPDKVFAGGRSDRDSLKIEPTILNDVTWADAVMGEEIFGPIMPILTFDDLDEVIDTVNGGDKPLALYIFAEDKAVVDRVLSRCAFGGGCVNDTIIHLATSHMGFGGVGESGMGAYHGKTGFDTFTHYKSVVDKKTWMDLPMRYQPYQKVYQKIIRLFLR